MAFGLDDAIVLAGIEAAGSYFGGDDTQQVSGFEPSDRFGRSRGFLPGRGGFEDELLRLQAGLFQQGAGALGGGMPSGLDLNALSSGKLSAGANARIHQQAFGGLNEGLQRAGRIAGERAQSRGLGGSTIEASQEAELQRPLIAQASQMQAALQNQELNRLSGLRQTFLSNILALQQSPTLDRLLQERLAEGGQDQIDLARFPGGLPSTTGDILDEDTRDNPQIIADINAQLISFNQQMMDEGVPQHERNKRVNEKRKELAAQNGFTIEDDFRIVE